MLCVSLRAPGSQETGLTLFASDQGLSTFSGDIPYLASDPG